MTITADLPLIGKPSGTLDAALDYAGTDNADYIKEVWRLCLLVGLDPAILIAQSAHETYDWTSLWWDTRINPAGIGITGDPAQNAASQIWANQTDAARGHVVHMSEYIGVGWAEVEDALRPYLHLDLRLPEVTKAGYAGKVRTIRDLTGKWATDPDYHTKIVNRHRAIFGTDATAPERNEGANAQMSTPATIDYSPLPVPVIIDLIGEDQPNQNPGIAMNPTSGTWHETANYANGADALMHQKWINAGAGGTQTSWHFTVDDKRIVQHIPLNRVAWHAGDGAGPGNYTSVAVECCTNADGDLGKAQYNTAALFGLLRAEGIVKEVYQHNHWSGKDCPRLLRQGNTVSWSVALEKVDAFARKYETPAAPQPAPIWWEPGEDVGIVTRESDGYKANAMLVQTYATTKRDVPVYDQIGGKKIAEIPAGKPAIIGGTTRAKDAKATGWYFVRVDGGYGRARASSFLDKLPLP